MNLDSRLPGDDVENISESFSQRHRLSSFSSLSWVPDACGGFPDFRRAACTGDEKQESGMARFQINLIIGMAIHPPVEFEGSYADARKLAEAQLEDYAPGTRYHIRIWRRDPVYPAWVPCGDPDFQEC